jgi:hypothetical protein
MQLFCKFLTFFGSLDCFSLKKKKIEIKFSAGLDFFLHTVPCERKNVFRNPFDFMCQAVIFFFSEAITLVELSFENESFVSL